MSKDKGIMQPDELREHLKTLNWTQAELAEQVGVSLRAVSHWVNGTRPCEGPAPRLIRVLVALHNQRALNRVLKTLGHSTC